MFTFEFYPADMCESQTVAMATALEEIMCNLYRLNERIFSSCHSETASINITGCTFMRPALCGVI
jgi:hypothetical protein